MRLGVIATAITPYMVQYSSVLNMKKRNQKNLAAQPPATTKYEENMPLQQSILQGAGAARSLACITFLAVCNGMLFEVADLLTCQNQP